MGTRAEGALRFLLGVWLGEGRPGPGCGHTLCPLSRASAATDPAQADAQEVASQVTSPKASSQEVSQVPHPEAVPPPQPVQPVCPVTYWLSSALSPPCLCCPWELPPFTKQLRPPEWVVTLPGASSSRDSITPPNHSLTF